MFDLRDLEHMRALGFYFKAFSIDQKNMIGSSQRNDHLRSWTHIVINSPFGEYFDKSCRHECSMPLWQTALQGLPESILKQLLPSHMPMRKLLMSKRWHGKPLSAGLQKVSA